MAWINEQKETDFWHADANSRKLRITLTILGGCGQKGHGFLIFE